MVTIFTRLLPQKKIPNIRLLNTTLPNEIIDNIITYIIINNCKHCKIETKNNEVYCKDCQKLF
jgi:hypothetical protein